MQQSHYEKVHHHAMLVRECFGILLKYWKMIAVILVVTSVFAVISSLRMTKVYKAEALIIPVSSKSGGNLASLSSQFGSLASLAGLSTSGATNDVEKFMAILKSRTLTENVINRMHLMPILFKTKWDEDKGMWKAKDPKKQPTLEDGVNQMRKARMRFADEKKNKTIRIEAKFTSPELAANVVNTYIEELQDFVTNNAFTMAKRNRRFIEQQLAENKKQLLEAGKEINEFYQGNRISSAEARIDVPVESVAMMDAGADLLKGGNVVGSQEHAAPIDGRTAELEKVQQEFADVDKKIQESKSVKDVPQQVYLSYLMLRRELLGKMNALLTSQYEMAKIEESKEELAFQVIDKAVPPVQRISPKRAQICVVAFMTAFMASILLAFLREYVKRLRALHHSARA